MQKKKFGIGSMKRLVPETAEESKRLYDAAVAVCAEYEVDDLMHSYQLFAESYDELTEKDRDTGIFEVTLSHEEDWGCPDSGKLYMLSLDPPEAVAKFEIVATIH